MFLKMNNENPAEIQSFQVHFLWISPINSCLFQAEKVCKTKNEFTYMYTWHIFALNDLKNSKH